MSLFAFQSWTNGSTQLSSLYEGEEAKEFIKRHNASSTFATLHQGGKDVEHLYYEMFYSGDDE